MKLWQALLLVVIGILAAAFLFSLVMIAIGPRM
jgi:hypothetical protein